MFTRDEALQVWDDLVAETDAFLMAHGELVLARQRDMSIHIGGEAWGYFVRAKNHCYTKEMFDGYNRVCAKHDCTYRIETDAPVIIFYKPRHRQA